MNVYLALFIGIGGFIAGAFSASDRAVVHTVYLNKPVFVERPLNDCNKFHSLESQAACMAGVANMYLETLK